METINKKNRNGKLIYSHYNVYQVKSERGTMTDSATAYAYHVAPIIAYKALSTMYANSGNKRIYNLMCELIHRSTVDVQAWENVMESNGQPTEMQTAKTHKYKVVTDGNGKKHRMEVIPYAELKLSEYGKKLMELTIPANLDCDDLIQVAVEKIVSLSNDGMITDFQSIWNCARLIFRSVNNYVYAQGKQSATTESYESMLTTYTHNGVFDENRYTETVLHGQTAKDYLSEIDMENMMESILSTVESKLSNRIDKKLAITVYKMVKVGFTYDEVAEKVKIGKTQVARYNEYVNRIVTSPSFRQYVADMLY